MATGSWSHYHGHEHHYHPYGIDCDFEGATDFAPPAVEKKPKWSISVNAIVEGTDKADSLYWSLCALTREMRKNHDYINVSSSLLDDDEVTEQPAEYADMDTMNKVRAAVKYAVLHHQGNIDKDIDQIIQSLQNYGILFRERR